ncbi:ABC transporter substrate-binding protein [Sphingomonas donggukensis]|uniref:ABC transporter substrate-binding protein n=1 Tax=Sphingomonas donggukensis TaxID=2949093 RepID=A0ABY4TWC3_9SPHN|nr:ABC transporter substrate-binding protein [Sphingomonas donggukensis]URW76691.1 ABC transporter substrate-binding protein [Sphingomonas donggukensis]
MKSGLAICLVLVGCAPAVPVRPAVKPMRVVSLDYCADQYVLKLLPAARIAAVSPDARAEFSYMRGAAAGVPQVRASAEDVLLLRPDMVVRSYGGGPNVAPLLARAGVPVLQLGYAEDLAGVKRVLIEAADGLGEHAAGAAMAAEIDARVAKLAKASAARSALYVTPGGVTTGPGSLVDAMMRAAGLRNFQTQAGWAPLPLERLAYAKPDVVAAAFFDTRWNRADPWSATAHPVARAAFRGRPTAALPGAWTACGGWFVLDAVEAMAKVAR